jgi:hypothetical protein
MKDIVFGIVILLLAGGVVLLFAMFGELASRLPDQQGGERSQDVWALESGNIGAAPATWPASIESHVTAPDHRMLFVLSTACAPCKGIAAQLSDEISAGSMPDVALVISTANHDNGEAFVKQYQLDALPHHIDEGGNWVRTEFGVDTSPSALTIHDGRLESVVAFQDINALRTVVDQRQKGVS